MSRQKAFSLVELLTVILIIILLAGILYPVVAHAKLTAKQTACIANLRQAVIGLNLYVEDVGEYPMGLEGIGERKDKKRRVVSPITAYVSGATNVFRCPLDFPEGRGHRLLSDRREPVSYAQTWNLWEGDQGIAAWKRLEQLDSNPTLFRCHFHEDRQRTVLLTSYKDDTGLFVGGWSLSAKKDGSVKYDKSTPPDAIKWLTDSSGVLNPKITIWQRATTATCPTDICDGEDPPEGYVD